MKIKELLGRVLYVFIGLGLGVIFVSDYISNVLK